KGIGFQVMNGHNDFQLPVMFAANFLLAFLGLMANRILVLLQRRLCRWNTHNQ
ncbi:MAG TPA: ABC transporter permease, partial [Atlantibacter hermannii]|nr:ABC transporter permease [Atlantibacter hermannii]